jgi:integrase/recombinase XerD
MSTSADKPTAMRKHHPANERIKRKYLTYLREARGHSEDTIDAVAAALSQFEVHGKYRDFRSFHVEQALAFKRTLAQRVSKTTGKQLSKRTALKRLHVLRDFFRWLAREPGYRSILSDSDADYFNLPERDVRIANATREKRVPTLEQILHVLNCMPSKTEIELRDRALLALCLLTGVRDGAQASLKLKHIDVVEGKIFQDAREVNTKFAKTFTTWFFPVPAEVRQIVVQWVRFVVKERLFGPDDPLFPSTAIGLCNRKFEAVGLSRSHWSTATPIRRIFKDAFARARVIQRTAGLAG